MTSGPLARLCTTMSMLPQSACTFLAHSDTVKPLPWAAAYRLLLATCTAAVVSLRHENSGCSCLCWPDNICHGEVALIRGSFLMCRPSPLPECQTMRHVYRARIPHD